ncbi:asparagine--tRNA ligase, cytoplasmic 2-like [Lycium barbarum]|uniref:asparagine--tRNA ligase, cytoplasmic 2-like n=1 Tax=Lycium barbarum TaxID=112863 RepID=UPI00293EB994|nr:asparagine--tRNA ligase, cytoplasmic 2-like [Lycium barbarum]
MASDQDIVEKIDHVSSLCTERVILKAILGRGDGGAGLIGEKVVIGGWVKSSWEIRKEAAQPRPVLAADAASPEVVGAKEMRCMEILQSRIPLVRYIVKVLGGGDHSVREKFVMQKAPKDSTSILQISDGSCVHNLRVLVDSALATPCQVMPCGTCILVEGILQQPLMKGKYQVIELKTEKILHLGTVDQYKYPLSKKRLPLESLRNFPHFRPRTTTVASVMRIHNALTLATHTFFQDQGFLHVQTPIITTNNSETLSKKFQVTTLLNNGKIDNQLVNSLEFSKDFFSQETYLIDCGHFHLESQACALGNVYSFGPRFKAEKSSESNNLLAETWMVDVEMAFSELEDAMDCADEFLKFVCKRILESCTEDIQFILKRIDKAVMDRLQLIISSSFEKISYDVAIEVLTEATGNKFEKKIEWGDSLTEEHESYLVNEIYTKPVIIYNHPKEIKSFYAKLNEDGKTVATFDVVLPKVGTLVRGSQSEECFDKLRTRIEELELPKQQYEWFLDLRKNGAAKTSGFNLMLEPLVLYATGLNDVKDVVPFPRSFGRAKF